MLPRVLLGLITIASASVAIVGAQKLANIDDAMEQNVLAARGSLRAGETAVISFVPGGTGRVAVQAGNERGEWAGKACAVLTFRMRKDVSVAVFDGTGPEALENGAGRSLDTAEPNTVGRCVLHGHRDSAFKPLASIKQGDEILLETANERVSYEVADIFVTEPTDMAIYEKTDVRQLALVTCYPFTFVGPAPERCVVIANEKKSTVRGGAAGGRP